MDSVMQWIHDLRTRRKNMSESYLSIRDLVVEYSSGGEKVQAVNGIDLDLQKGETIGLVGETGAGKTTILNILIGEESYDNKWSGKTGWNQFAGDSGA